MDLGETSRKIFIFCNVPQQWHHELGLCVVLYARVERRAVVGADIANLPGVSSLILIRRHRGIKRPGPTLHVLLRETGSTD